MSKIKINSEAGTINVDGTDFDPNDLPKSILRDAMLHGIAGKLRNGDSPSETWDALKAGRWRTPTPFVVALSRVQGVSVDKAQAFVDGLTSGQQTKLRNHPPVAEAIEKVMQERGYKKQPNQQEVSDILSGLGESQ